MLQNSKFIISDSNYKDGILTHPYHYNSMRAKPTFPQSVIENNISSSKPYSDNWVTTKDEWIYFKDDKQFAKRTLFNANETNQKIHLASLGSLTYQHLDNRDISFPNEDDVYRAIGQKRVVANKRNHINELSPGDKTYKIAEYSNEFYKKSNRNWRSEKYELPKKSEETLSSDMMNLLNLNTSSNLFSNKYDVGYESDPRIEKREEISDVKSLDTWKSAPKLDLPFKVLDLTDKSLKYRPKVTR